MGRAAGREQKPGKKVAESQAGRRRQRQEVCAEEQQKLEPGRDRGGSSQGERGNCRRGSSAAARDSVRSASSGSASPRPASPCARAGPPAPPPQRTPGCPTALVCHGPGERREQFLLEKASGRHKEDLRVQGDPRNVSGCWGPEGGSGIGGGSFTSVAAAAAASTTTTAAEIDWSLYPHCSMVRSCGGPSVNPSRGSAPTGDTSSGRGRGALGAQRTAHAGKRLSISLATTALHRFSPHA